VCHLVEELGATQSLVSHHLRVLRDAGLVTGERWRYWTYYRLVPGAVDGIAARLSSSVADVPPKSRRPCC
jgi:ArsR family transcriptional regulator